MFLVLYVDMPEKVDWGKTFLVILLMVLGVALAIGVFVFFEPIYYSTISPGSRYQQDSIYVEHERIIATARSDFAYMDGLIHRWNANMDKIDDGTKVEMAIAISNEFTEFVHSDYRSHLEVIDGDFYNNNAKYLNERYGISLDIEGELEDSYYHYHDQYQIMRNAAFQMKQAAQDADKQAVVDEIILDVVQALI